MVKLTQSKASAAGPSSSIGIMRFFDVDAKGPKLSPEFIVGASVAFVVLVIILRVFKVF